MRRRVATDVVDAVVKEMSTQMDAVMEKASEQSVATSAEFIKARNQTLDTFANGGITRKVSAKTVKAVWAAETFSPKLFHVCVVGPFELEAVVPEGENALEVLEKLREELRHMAEKERDRKLKSFMTAMTRGE
jgi:hypothetical protein